MSEKLFFVLIPVRRCHCNSYPTPSSLHVGTAQWQFKSHIYTSGNELDDPGKKKKKSLKFLDYFPASETSHLRMQINQQKYSKVVYLLEDRKKKKKRRDEVGGWEGKSLLMLEINNYL